MGREPLGLRVRTPTQPGPGLALVDVSATSLLVVPVHTCSGMVSLRCGRLPSGERVGIAFTAEASLARAMGAGRPWIQMSAEAMRPASADLNQVLTGYAALASQLGGQLTALQGSPAETLAKFAHRHQVTEILLARDPGASRHRLLNELTHRAGDAEVHVLPAQAAR